MLYFGPGTKGKDSPRAVGKNKVSEMSSKSRESGFSLIGFLIVIILSVIIATLSMVAWKLVIERCSVRSAAERMISDIRLLYFRSIARHQDLYLRFLPDENAYLLIDDVDKNGDPTDGAVTISRVELPAAVRFGRNSVETDTPDEYGISSDICIDDGTDYFSFFPNGIGERKKGTIYLTDGDMTCAVTVLNLTGRAKAWKYGGNDWKPM